MCSTTSAISYSAVPLRRHHLVHRWSSLGKPNMDTFPFILLRFQYLPLNRSAGAEWTGYWGQSLSTTNYCIFLLRSFSFFFSPSLSCSRLAPHFTFFLLHFFSDELANAKTLNVRTLKGKYHEFLNFLCLIAIMGSSVHQLIQKIWIRTTELLLFERFFCKHVGKCTVQILHSQWCREGIIV